MLTKNDIVEYQLMTQEKLNKEFYIACNYGNLELVKFLLTSQELKQHAIIDSDNNAGFKLACICGNLNIIRYLVTSPELEKNVNVHVHNDICFKWALDLEFIEIINFLVYEQDIKVTNEMIEHMNEQTIENSNDLEKLILISKVEKMLEIKNFKNKLSGQLILKEENKVLKKI